MSDIKRGKRRALKILKKDVVQRSELRQLADALWKRRELVVGEDPMGTTTR